MVIKTNGCTQPTKETEYKICLLSLGYSKNESNRISKMAYGGKKW